MTGCRGPSHAALAMVAWLAFVAVPADAFATEEQSPRSRFQRWMAVHPQWLLGHEGLAVNEVLRLGVTYAVMGSSLAAIELAAQPPREARWKDDNDFDEAIRDVFMGDSRSSRSAAGTASDVLLGALGVVLFFDRLWLRSENPVLKTLLFDGTWLLSNEVVTQTVKVAAGRRRPYVEPCNINADYVSECDEGRNGNASFFSGHTSATATLAGLICSRHLHRSSPGWPDWIACGGAAAVSATTGALRVTAEQHHATDVLAGWASGVLFGYVLPSRFDRASRDDSYLSLVPIEPVVTPHFLGVRVEYSF